MWVQAARASCHHLQYPSTVAARGTVQLSSELRDPGSSAAHASRHSGEPPPDEHPSGTSPAPRGPLIYDTKHEYSGIFRIICI